MRLPILVILIIMRIVGLVETADAAPDNTSTGVRGVRLTERETAMDNGREKCREM
jgi:hypothetical protein